MIHVRRTVKIAEVDAEIWRMYFALVKAVLLVAATAVYSVSLAAFFVIQNATCIAERFYRLVATWHPVKPTMFRFDNLKLRRVVREGETSE